ncbi:hypothetical protein O1611_g5288 [Lasiodiplodia mahajangana]|uniref:Uncharacterized protein n=1 Tax=Lasiodiplodia mahajangana TaxID=1108764 RepID=A0ACC2JLG3_9PEZI|nr:hypothetical protein O1611_g5288 [Lasiodiplodia mahajangana]
MDQHRSKRRKTKDNDPSVVKISGKTISLSAFLAPPPKKTEEKTPSVPLRNGTASNGDKQEEQNSVDGVDERTPRKQPQADAKGPLKKAKRERETPMLKARKALPIWAYRDEIKASLRGDNDILLIVGILVP